MRLWKLILVLGCSLAIAPEANAGFFFDLNGFYYSDTLKGATTTTLSRMLYDVTVGFSINKSGHYQVGWDYVGHSTSDNDGTTNTTYSATQMGPRFIFYFDKKRVWRTSLAYNLVTAAKYSTGGGVTETWRGTALVGDIGYQLALGDSSALGLRVNYNAATFKESLVNDTNFSKVSYGRTLIYPSLALTFEF